MQQEIEAKYVRIDPNDIRTKLEGLGAKCVQPERLMRRYVYDFSDRRLNDNNSWVRLRDEGNVVTLTFKKSGSSSLTDTSEVMTKVDDFEATHLLLLAIGLTAESYQESKRESWSLNGVDVELDEWPWLPPYIEIESTSAQKVHHMADRLGLAESQKYVKDVGNLYADTYGIDPDIKAHTTILKFGEKPAWVPLAS